MSPEKRVIDAACNYIATREYHVSWHDAGMAEAELSKAVEAYNMHTASKLNVSSKY